MISILGLARGVMKVFDFKKLDDDFMEKLIVIAISL